MSPSTPVRQLSITLNNGVELPALGFGVFQSPPDVTPASVEEALRVGYRMIDAAAAYFNEREVGAAVGAIGVNRSELFLQTKAWVSDYGYDETLHAFDVSTRKLEVDTIDLYMLHQPLPQHFEKTLEAYRAVEHLLEEGRVRAIGVQLHPGTPRQVPTAGQRHPRGQPSRSSPLLQPAGLRALHDERGIVTQAWSPLGGVYVYPRPRAEERTR